MSDRVATVESLEGRRLLSATPVYGQWQVGMSKGQWMQQMQAAQYQQEVAHAVAVGKAAGITPSVLGTWTGTVKAGAFFVTKKFHLTLDVTKVRAHKAFGTVTVDGHKYSGTFAGQTKATEEFSYTYAKGNQTLTIAGLLNGLNTAATGTVTAKYHGWTVKGTFRFTKVA